jgi:chitin synthase
MNTGAFCKTEAVQTFKSLLKQRRRWFLGFVTNEVCMLTDIRLWKCYPLLLVIRLAQNTIRTTALLFFVLVISLLTTSQKISNLPVGFIAVSLGLNWVLMIYFAAKLGRYKVILYPLMFVVNPAFNWLYMVVSMSSRAGIVNANTLAIVWCLHRGPAYLGWTKSRRREGRRENYSRASCRRC